MSLPKDLVQRVEGLIMATKDSSNQSLKNTWTKDKKLFVDLDRLVLASDPCKYNSYLSGLEKEYQRFPTWFFVKRRKDWIKSTLNKKMIFLSDRIYSEFEEKARKNLTVELDSGWGIFGLKGIYDPSEHRMENYLNARKIFEDNRLSLVKERRGEAVTICKHGLVQDDEKTVRLSDEHFSFIIRTEEEERQYLLSRFSNIYDPLIQPYLDTDMPEWRYEARAALKLRGIPEWFIRLLYFLVGTGAWWNILAWERERISYLQFGWWLKLNSGPLGFLGIFLGYLGAGFSLIPIYTFFLGVIAALIWTQIVLTILKKTNHKYFGSKTIPDDAGFG